MIRTTHFLNLALLCVVSIFLSACGGGGSSSSSESAGSTDLSIEEIKVSPVNTDVPLNTDLKLYAQAVYSDGTSKDVTGSVNWSSSNPTIAAFDTGSAGLLSSKKQGAVQVLATLGSLSGVASIRVTSPVLDHLELSIDTLELARGETSFVQVKGAYQGNVDIDVTDRVTWTSDDDSIASVVSQGGNAGLITGKAKGSAVITASLGTKLDKVTVTVTSDDLVSVSVSAVNTNIPDGALAKLTASATFSDGSQEPVTEQGLWTSNTPSVATVSNLPSMKGNVSALSSGPVTISFQMGTKSDQVGLTVDPASNAPGALTLQAVPNVILNDGFDTSKIIATVSPNDTEHGVVVSSLVKFNSSPGLALNFPQQKTVSGKVENTASSSTEGQYDLIAEVPKTIAIDQVTLRVVSDFSDAIGVFRTEAPPAVSGYFEKGSTFMASIINISNRPFKLESLTLYNGMDKLVLLNSNGSELTMGETSKATLKLKEKVPDKGVSMEFELSDTPTGTTFTKKVVFY